MRRLHAFSVAIAVVLIAGCGSAATTERPAEDESGLSGELTVFAAASLMAPFTEVAHEFSVANPGLTVNPISFDGSSTLATQINEGAPADVFASADQANLDKVELLADSAAAFAGNSLQIAVGPGNPRHIAGLADLGDDGLQVVLCAPAVPCGAQSQSILSLSGVDVTPVSEEQNVKAVLTKVRSGEADAGLVYVTDVIAAAGAVDGIRIAGAERAASVYPIAVLKRSENASAARAFVDFVLSPDGQAIMARHGFTAP